MAIADGELSAICDCLNALVMQLIDMNTTMSELHSRLVVHGAMTQCMVDELRTLNYHVAVIEEEVKNRP